MTNTLNMDFSQRVVVTPNAYKWVASPVAGVTRMMLDRQGGETGRATSLVRYAPNSDFNEHMHTGGEEFLVLEGTFSDEHGDYPAGSYVRNPIGTRHKPKIGSEGALIFVKLHQFSTTDTTQVYIDTTQATRHQGLVPGLHVIPLHDHDVEHTALVQWSPDTKFQTHQHFGGEEILVIQGTFHDEFGSYPAGSWIRSPHRSQHTPYTKEDGALIYVKTGHLNS